MSMPVINPSNVNRCQAISDIIESIALEQTALSHILNAEGEKLQVVIASTDVSKNDLILFNKSVKDMIDAITQLEFILQSKLALFKDCLCLCEIN